MNDYSVLPSVEVNIINIVIGNTNKVIRTGSKTDNGSRVSSLYFSDNKLVWTERLVD